MLIVKIGQSIRSACELERLLKRNLLTVLIDVVDVSRAVAGGRQDAGVDADRVVGMLARIVKIISGYEILWGLAFHL